MTLRPALLALTLGVGCAPPIGDLSLRIDPEPARTGDDLQAIVGMPTDAPEGLVLRYAWTQNGRARIDLPSETVPRTRTRKGETWTVEVTGGAGSRTIVPLTATVRIRNTPPSIQASWRTEAPQVTDDLEVRVQATDDDEDPVRLRFVWTRDGQPTPFDGPIVPAAETRRGELWEVTIEAFDGEQDGDPVTLTARVDNSAPRVGIVRLDPRPATTVDAVRATPIRPTDADGDPISYHWAFFVDGVQVQEGPSDTLGPEHFAKGQRVRVRVTPSDPYDAGDPRWSDDLRIDNSPPTAPGVAILDEHPRAGAPLTCALTAPSTDSDADPLHYEALWMRNGEPFALVDLDREGLAILPEFIALPTDRWSCTGVVTDGDVVVTGPSVEVTIPEPIVAISPGWNHTCALQADGMLWCWGANTFGGLGDGTARERLTPIPVYGKERFTQVSSGGHHTCALDEAGDAWCWGNNWFGQVGDGTYIERRSPARVAGEHRFVALSAGAWHTCGIDEDDALWCWGQNTGGAAGVGDWADRAEPTRVVGDHRWAQVSASLFHTCAITTDARLACWGNGTDGQTGDGARWWRNRPAVIDDGPFAMVTGYELASCALRTNGSAWCWGSNVHGQLGDGTRTLRARPVPVAGGHRFTELAMGAHHTCGLRDDDQILCWGDNRYYQLGDETTTPALVPRAVLHDVDATGGVFSGQGTVCTQGIDAWGYDAAWCWGSNATGQLADGTTVQRAERVEIRVP